MVEYATAIPWERFEKELPTFYVCAKSRWREEEAFWRSAESIVRFAVGRIIPSLARRHRAVVVGAGVGRLTVPIAKAFTRVVIVDPSPFLCWRLQDYCAEFHIGNLEPIPLPGPWDAVPAQFICSMLAFQHPHEAAEVEATVQRIARCCEGIALLHFDTRPMTWELRARRTMPEWMRSKRTRWDDAVARWDARWLRSLFLRVGLQVIGEIGVGTRAHAFILERAPVPTRPESITTPHDVFASPAFPARRDGLPAIEPEDAHVRDRAG